MSCFAYIFEGSNLLILFLCSVLEKLYCIFQFCNFIDAWLQLSFRVGDLTTSGLNFLLVFGFGPSKPPWLIRHNLTNVQCSNFCVRMFKINHFNSHLAKLIQIRHFQVLVVEASSWVKSARVCEEEEERKDILWENSQEIPKPSRAKRIRCVHPVRESRCGESSDCGTAFLLAIPGNVRL